MLSKTPIVDTYLSAAELGITEKEREALIAVRNDLASGVIPPKRFDMAQSGNYSCGTVACIGGHMGMRQGLKGERLTDYVNSRTRPLDFLFYPHNGCYAGQTPAQAVRAIDAWATGNQSNCWQLALDAEDA